MEKPSKMIFVLTVLAFLSLQAASNAENSRLPVSDTASAGRSEVKTTAANLDTLVQEYLKAVRVADSVDALAEFLPASRISKFRDECTSKQRTEWLQFRKSMPPMVALVKSKVHDDKAVLTYQCPDAPPFQGGKKIKKMAEIMLIRENGHWKVAHESFAPAKIISRSSVLNF